MSIFPFAAIVGQDQLKLALMICAVNHSVGGVLVRGEKGTAKSTAARALTQIMPNIDSVVGCKFNCIPGKSISLCDVCENKKAKFHSFPVPFINLPLGATEDRVIGSLDFERALKEGRKAFQPGLLASANRGVLYIDEVNLLPDHLVDVLLDAAAMGENRIEREGLTFSHPAQITLIGTMNPEEGDLRPQLLDRFGMMVEIKAPMESKVRAEVVRRRMAFDQNKEEFAKTWEEETIRLSQKIASAQRNQDSVVIKDNLLEAISLICCELGAVSLRADITMNKVARTIAALNGRPIVQLRDVKDAAELVLPHRKRRNPTDQSGLDQDQLDSLMENIENQLETEQTEDTESPAEDEVFSASDLSCLKVNFDGDSTAQKSGTRSAVSGGARGQYVRSVRNQNPSHLAVDSTVKASILRNDGKLDVTRDDFHEKVRAGKTGNLFVFVVDSSSSVGAMKRMELVKGAAIALLQDIYQRRDHIAVVTFRGASADVLVPATRSIDIVDRSLRDLPTGGRTPLASALQATEKLVRNSNSSKYGEPILIVLTDGKANVALSTDGDPWEESLALSRTLSDKHVTAVVIDTETGLVRLGRAKSLAQALSADCFKLDELTSENLVLHIRNTQVRVRPR
jgi:magnesium chelatase subunit D